MLDVRELRRDPHKYADLLKLKGYDLDVDHFLSLEAERSRLQQATESSEEDDSSSSSSEKDEETTPQQAALYERARAMAEAENAGEGVVTPGVPAHGSQPRTTRHAGFRRGDATLPYVMLLTFVCVQCVDSCWSTIMKREMIIIE